MMWPSEQNQCRHGVIVSSSGSGEPSYCKHCGAHVSVRAPKPPPTPPDAPDKMVQFAGIKFIEDPAAVAPYLESDLPSMGKVQRAYIMCDGRIRIVERPYGEEEWREVFHPERTLNSGQDETK